VDTLYEEATVLRVKIFPHEPVQKIETLEKKIHDWIDENSDKEIVDIKLGFQLGWYSAMIVYKNQ